VLAISKQPTKMMGGIISVTGTPGKGSTFRITLPLPHGRQTWTSDPASNALAGLRVLVVDDITINLGVVKQYVDGWGLRSACYERSLHALEELREAARRGLPLPFRHRGSPHTPTSRKTKQKILTSRGGLLPETAPSQVRYVFGSLESRLLAI
jgi:hypothetical protein